MGDTCYLCAQLLFFASAELGIGDQPFVEVAREEPFDLLRLHEQFGGEWGQHLPVPGGVFVDEVGLLVEVLVVLVVVLFHFADPEVFTLALDLAEQAHVFSAPSEGEVVETLLQKMCLVLPEVDACVAQHQE